MKYSDLKMKYSNLRFAVSVVLALLLVSFGVYGSLTKDRKRDRRLDAVEREVGLLEKRVDALEHE